MAEQNYYSSILVVDDEAAIVQLCRRFLEKEGFNVITFTDPQEGLLFLDQNRVHLLLIDVRMPGIDGFEFLEQAYLLHPGLAVIIMTGYGTLETAIKALQQGANGLVLKPFEKKELVETVRRALKDHQHKYDALRLQALHPLFAVTESLFIEIDPERLQKLLLNSVCDLLICDRAGLYHRAGAGQSQQLQAQVGKPLVGLESPIFQHLQQKGEATILTVSHQGEIGRNDEISIFLKLNDLGSFLFVPLEKSSKEKESGGFLWAGREFSFPPFSQLEQEIVSILARQAGVALENAWLHSNLQANIQQMQQSQQALIQAEKLAVAGRLTASIAHEINNPLQSVQNCLSLARRSDLPSDQRQEYLQMAQLELERLMKVVQQMLDYFRPSAIQRKPADIKDIVDRVLSLMENQLIDQNIRYQAQHAIDLPLLPVVQDQIQQVILNLILNALEAMPTGGTLSITTNVSGDFVEILIEDSGHGIPASDREKIFEPFFSTKEGGTGLGLAVSYRIISAHGGTLEVNDGEGTGACFRISLPIGESP